jgi:hypothetical protein
VKAPAEHAADLTAALAAQGLYLHGLKVVERSLESFFLAVTAPPRAGGTGGGNA